ncbi:MAG TPA: LirA/MavJ family T4SS effector [Terrimicrobiaceae bacterium]
MIEEIKDQPDAKAKLKECFGEIEHIDDYAWLLAILSSKDFVQGLEEVSAMIWKAYNSQSIKEAPNRFTRAIIEVANTHFGFSCQSNVVLTAAASSQAFGNRIKDGVLWKDSFTLGHGEFAHSYQWLTAGLLLKWGPKTAELYKNTAGKQSIVAMFVRDNRGMVLRRANLWEYLVDCTRYQKSFDNEADRAVESWPTDQLEKWAKNETVSSAFVNAFFRGTDPAIKGGMKERDPAIYTDVWAKAREAKPGPALLKSVESASDMETFKESLWKLYPTRNALTETSCRNANNVTDLAKNPPTKTENGWFITAYENHRYRSLNLKSNQKLREMTSEKLADALSTTGEVSKEDVSKAYNLLVEKVGDIGAKDFYDKLQSTFKETTNWSQRDVKNLFREELQGISALKRERKEHYSSIPKQSQKWEAHKDDESIFIRAIANEIVEKKRLPETFHGMPGLINAKVMSNDLII